MPADTKDMSAVGVAARPNAFGPEFEGVLAAARAGAPWALRQLYDAFAGAVLGYARSQGSRDPEGLVNDVFTRAFRRVRQFDGDEGSFRSWLFIIAHNAVIDERRHWSRRVELAAEPTDRDFRNAVPSAEEQAMGGIEHEAVLSVLRQLPEDQREVLTLRLVGDLTVAQIAEIQGRSVGAVKALQRRGLARLRRILEQGVPL